MGTYQKSLPMNYQTLTYSWADFLAKIYQSPENEKDYQEAVADYFMKLCEYLKLKDQHIYSLKTLDTCLVSGKARHSKPSCGKFQNWGMTANGLYFTARISENRSQDREFISLGLFGKNPTLALTLGEPKKNGHGKHLTLTKQSLEIGDLTGGLMLAKGLSKKHRYCLNARRGLEVRTTTGKKLGECPPELYEIMQGFRLGWTEGIPKTWRKFVLGNSITPDIPKEIFKLLKSPRKDCVRKFYHYELRRKEKNKRHRTKRG